MKRFLQNIFYGYLFKNKIVYNACMEDPRTDMLLLDPIPGSNICMLGSGGCNALHYALNSNFDAISCVDANPCQVALVNIKKQVIENGIFEDLWKMFGDGLHENIKIPYEKYYRPGLDCTSASFWDKKLKTFEINGSNKGFHFNTGCGFITRCFSLLEEEHLRQIAKIFELDDTKQQTLLYEKYLEPVFNNLFTRTIINLTTRLGIPSRQVGMINTDPTKVLRFLNERIKKVLTHLPANDNYFFHVYIFGHYKRSSVPEYLNEANFNLLKKAHRKIKVENAYLADYLKNSSRRFSHFALLDHLDWLVPDPKLLEHQWRAILSNSKFGTKILVRSYLYDFEWMPEFVKKHIAIDMDIEEKVMTDRLGIYNRTYLLRVRKPLVS